MSGAQWQIRDHSFPSFDHNRGSIYADSVTGGSAPAGADTIMVQASAPYNNAAIQAGSSSNPPNSHDMRTFRVHGPYGLNISLSTDIPGSLSISFPGRAQSEPTLMSSASNPPSSSHQSLPASLFRSQNDYTVNIPIDQRMAVQNKSFLASPAPPIPRSVSPAPTEIDPESVDPTPDEIAADLQSRGIKVRDFALAPTLLAPIPEIFDQYKALAEYEYRLSQHPRAAPIAGKTLRRLLDMKWLSPSELAARLDSADWDALRTHDAGPGAAYPYTVYAWTRVPTREERAAILKDRGGWFVALDRVLKAGRDAEGREEREREEAKRVWEIVQRREREMDVDEGPSTKKRAYMGDDDDEPKRLKLTSPPAMPPKQYPAPLTSYDPELYPHAASVRQVAGPSQAQSQGSAPTPTPSPPKDQRQDTPPLEAEEEGEKRPGGLKRTLSRTQTFSQL